MSIQKAFNILSICTARSVQQEISEGGNGLPYNFKIETVRTMDDGTMVLYRMKTEIWEEPFELPSFADESQVWPEDGK